MKKVDIEKYKRKLENELGSGGEQQKDIAYSQEYRQFLAEQTSTSRTFYSKACRLANKLLHAPISQKDYDEVSKYIQLLHMNVTPQSTLSLAYVSAILVVILSLIGSVLFFSFYPVIFGLVAAVIVMYVLSKAPKFMFKTWRAKASDQLVSAVLYMVIYLEHTSNLEQAVYFAAKNLPPPLSLDFIRTLWLVESGEYSTISEALEEYVKIWQEWDPGFVEAVHMLESSLYVKTEDRRHEILERTISTILDSTQQGMMKYTHDIQNPIQAVHMLGIILPVMGLVMLPLVVSFMGDVVKTWQIIFLYNVLLPIVVFVLAKSSLDSRPSGVNTSDIYQYYNYKNYKAGIKLGSKIMYVKPKIIAFLVMLLFFAPATYYFMNLYSTQTEALNITANTLLTLSMSVLYVAGIGFGFGVYYYLRVKNILPQQKALEKLDEEFSNSIFQLGNRLEEGIPIESALKKVADSMPQSEVAVFFNKIYQNLVESQMTLRDAIFDPQNGAAARISSSLIRGVMNILVEGAKKGSKIVAFSLITISKFMTTIRNVNERLKDLLAETIASLQSEVKVFIPLISGIVVSMAVLTTNILVNLSIRLKNINLAGGSEEQLGFGATLLDIFKLDYLIPSWIFQLIVGIYLIQVTFIMSYLLSGIVHGPQKVEQDNALQKNLFISTAIYVLVTIAMSAMFMMLTRNIGGAV